MADILSYVLLLATLGSHFKCNCIIFCGSHRLSCILKVLMGSLVNARVGFYRSDAVPTDYKQYKRAEVLSLVMLRDLKFIINFVKSVKLKLVTHSLLQ